jgi:hypothetical protein
MKRILSVFLLLLLLAPVALADLPAIPLDAEVEAKLDQYIAEYALTEECKAVIAQYLPDVNQLDRIEQEGLAAYSIIMHDGTVYYLAVMKDKTPTCLQSSEKDYKARTRYYDRFAK